MLFALTAAGCGETGPPDFQLNMTQAVSLEIVPEHQQDIADTLGAMFGTPDEPFALPETGLDIKKLQLAAGPSWSDEGGTKYGLYRRHCAHCHGVSGDGQGPTAVFLNPYPRDYRPGIFKFKSTYGTSKPSDDDIRRVLVNGVPGTAMPSFSLLPTDELEALLEYVKYLSFRGEFETRLASFIADEMDYDADARTTTDPFDPSTNEEHRALVMELLAEVVEPWEAASSRIVQPTDGPAPDVERSADELAASVAKGRELFYGARANCVKCHGPTALGDGQQTDYTEWAKVTQKFFEDTERLAEEIRADGEGLQDLSGEDYADAQQALDGRRHWLADRKLLTATLFPLRNAIPRNLRISTYRGGNRKLDLFWRVHNGIAGTPMPAQGPAEPGATGTLTNEEMWNIVDYVMSLPFEPASLPKHQPRNVETLN